MIDDDDECVSRTQYPSSAHFPHSIAVPASPSAAAWSELGAWHLGERYMDEGRAGGQTSRTYEAKRSHFDIKALANANPSAS
jgi:hypothetical protein